jgi:UDP-2-acetamido-3-amino-2,3-dideoxy-glucuronate N-acetyltransferase
MNIWLVGAGYWGSKVLESLKKFDVHATIIDIKNGQTINDINTQDPVMLATPLWEHYEQAKYLIQRGHDVYIEKPMAESAPKIAELAGYITSDQVIMVGHIFVLHPQLQQIKKLIAQDTIGKLQHISSRRLNWGIYQTKTDPLLSLAVHDVSIIQQFCTERMQIDFARGWNYSNNTQPDRVYFTGTSGDVTYEVDVSWHWPIRTRETVFVGTTGQIVWDQDANTITQTNHKIENRRAVVDPTPIIIEYDSELTPLDVEVKHWVDCIQSRLQPITNVSQALQIALVIDQASHAIG